MSAVIAPSQIYDVTRPREKERRPGFGRLVARAVVGLIFLLEYVGGLCQWRATNKEALVPVAFLSLTFLAMIWILLFLVALLFSGFVRKARANSRAFFVLRTFAAAVVSAVWLFVVLNLGVRHALGCYLNPSLIRFACANISAGLWAHTATKYRWMFFAVVLFLVISTPIVFMKIWRHAWRLQLPGHPGVRRAFLITILLVACAFTFSTVAINREDYKEFKTPTVRHLCYKVEPMFAFSTGCADLYREMHDERNVLTESTLTPRSTPFAPSSPADKPNIILVQIESCRPDVIGMMRQGMEVTPNLNRLAKAGTRFTKAYAPGTHTSLSNVSIPSSLCALRSSLLAVYKASDPQPRTFICDVLKPLGYRTAWISSDFEGWAGMRDYIETSNLDVFMDATTMLARTPNSAGLVHVKLEPDTNTFEQAINWLGEELQKKEPFYLTLSLSDSHFPYDSSLHTNWFQPCGIPEGCSIFDYPKSAKEQVLNTYLNSIRGIDVLVGRLMLFLHEQNADDHTIIVVYGDHGESFYENGVLSHANLPYDPSARTTLLMYGKGYFPAKEEDYPTSLIDVVPTVLARLGVPKHPNFQGSDVLSPSRPPAADRMVYIHVDGRINGDGLVAGGRWKYFTDNQSGATYLYDLATDPGELHNLVASKPDIADFLGQQLNTYCTGQLAYYRLPHYYAHFYPPAPPQLKQLNDAPIQ